MLDSSEYEIECSEIVITCQDKSTNLRYTTSGTIRQNKSGELELRAIWKAPTPSQFVPVDTESLVAALEHGTVIPSTALFQIEAQSVDGKIWSAKDIYLESNSYFNTEVAVFSGSLQKITNRTNYLSPRASAYSKQLIFDTSLTHLAANKYSDHGILGKNLDLTELKLGSINCVIQREQKRITINLNSNKSISNSVASAVKEALEIATGHSLLIIYESAITPRSITTIIHSKVQKENLWALPAPISFHSPADINNLLDFLKKYQRTPQGKRKIIYTYWREIGSSSTSTLEPFAKSITSNVDGLVQKLFQSQSAIDTAFVAECEAARSAIETYQKLNPSEISERALNRISSNLRNAGAPSTKNTLYILFDKDIADHWNNLRHRALHGSIYGLFNRKQDLLNYIYGCLFIFYELMMSVIGYKKERINYAEKGYPRSLSKLKLSKKL
ncbi:hypothetical protein [Stutzerimonas nitrititolerans]|uniref:hypothetical protein n=1 Tax=Stutzerimonas nitrititolerans TaxID=2482751 RepID=UPI0028A9FF20|nr:hypothetical protein [Stutzerimonas nitrititolerans]